MKKSVMQDKRSDIESADTEYISPIEDVSLRLLKTAEVTQKEMVEYYPRMLDESNSDEVQNMADSLKRTSVNVTKALAQIYSLNDEFGARMKDINRQRGKKKFRFSTPANAEIDITESRSDHFAKGINLYKLLLICIIGSFIGVLVELLWCLVTNGYLESRSGLVYGPFNLLYGAGAVALTLCLYRFRNRGAWLSFLGGMIVGSGLEYLCSWAQELLIGSRSWDYSDMPFNINGRICLRYSIFWGLLGVLWVKTIYPIMAKWILKLPNRAGKIMTWALVAFFVFNSIITVIALTRWTYRMDGINPSNAFEQLIDDRFNDERMERVFANMKFIE